MTADDLVRAMVGRELAARRRARPAPSPARRC